MKRLIILIALISTQASVFSQNESEIFMGSWYTFGSTHRLTERFSLSPYGELRFYEPSSNYNLAFISLRGNYHLNSKSSVGFGYAYLDIDTVFEFDDMPHVIEHRLIEQFVHNQKSGKFKIQHRVRLEQRFLHFSTSDELQQRIRYRLSLKYKINDIASLFLNEEPFMDFQNQVFHENRLFIGLELTPIKNTQIQVGYLKHHIRKNNLNRFMVGLSFQTDSRQPKTTVAQQ